MQPMLLPVATAAADASQGLYVKTCCVFMLSECDCLGPRVGWSCACLCGLGWKDLGTLFSRQDLCCTYGLGATRPIRAQPGPLLAIDEEWSADIFDAHQIGANAVAWSPVQSDMDATVADGLPELLRTNDLSSLRLASGGCDNLIKFWK